MINAHNTFEAGAGTAGTFRGVAGDPILNLNNEKPLRAATLRISPPCIFTPIRNGLTYIGTLVRAWRSGGLKHQRSRQPTAKV